MSVYEALKADARSKEIARDIGEDPAQKLSQIEILRNWIIQHPWIECRTDDKFLLRFLRVSKFSCENAKERIQRLCMARSSKLDGIPEWFSNQDPNDPALRRILDTGLIYLLPKPDNLGRIIVVFDMEAVGKQKYDPEEVMRTVYMVFEWIIHSFERAQLNGVACIEIGSNHVDMEAMKYWTIERLKKSINIWQCGAMPARFKMIHYYNMPVVMKTLIDAGMKFMKPKMAKRLCLHSDLKHDENIPEDLYPTSVNGTAPPFAELKAGMFRELENFKAEFDSFKDCKVDELKMPKHYEEGDSWGISGTYRTIANAAD